MAWQEGCMWWDRCTVGQHGNIVSREQAGTVDRTFSKFIEWWQKPRHALLAYTKGIKNLEQGLDKRPDSFFFLSLYSLRVKRVVYPWVDLISFDLLTSTLSKVEQHTIPQSRSRNKSARSREGREVSQHCITESLKIKWSGNNVLDWIGCETNSNTMHSSLEMQWNTCWGKKLHKREDVGWKWLKVVNRVVGAKWAPVFYCYMSRFSPHQNRLEDCPKLRVSGSCVKETAWLTSEWADWAMSCSSASSSSGVLWCVTTKPITRQRWKAHVGTKIWRERRGGNFHKA